MKLPDIIIFGIQGAGKGTQGALLAEKKDLTIFETGGELRKIRAEDSELGRTVKGIMDRGDLVTNEIVMDIIENFLNTNKNARILFDGIPRSLEQKATFDALLKKYDRSVEGIFLTIPREEAINRMLERGRADDTQEVIERRLGNYEKETLPVIREYENAGVVTEINGIGEIESISEEILKSVS
jgi:adenylate kinase